MTNSPFQAPRILLHCGFSRIGRQQSKPTRAGWRKICPRQLTSLQKTLNLVPLRTTEGKNHTVNRKMPSHHLQYTAKFGGRKSYGLRLASAKSTDDTRPQLPGNSPGESLISKTRLDEKDKHSLTILITRTITKTKTENFPTQKSKSSKEENNHHIHTNT